MGNSQKPLLFVSFNTFIELTQAAMSFLGTGEDVAADKVERAGNSKSVKSKKEVMHIEE